MRLSAAAVALCRETLAGIGRGDRTAAVRRLAAQLGVSPATVWRAAGVAGTPRPRQARHPEWRDWVRIAVALAHAAPQPIPLDLALRAAVEGGDVPAAAANIPISTAHRIVRELGLSPATRRRTPRMAADWPMQALLVDGSTSAHLVVDRRADPDDEDPPLQLHRSPLPASGYKNKPLPADRRRVLVVGVWDMCPRRPRSRSCRTAPRPPPRCRRACRPPRPAATSPRHGGSSPPSAPGRCRPTCARGSRRSSRPRAWRAPKSPRSPRRSSRRAPGDGGRYDGLLRRMDDDDDHGTVPSDRRSVAARGGVVILVRRQLGLPADPWAGRQADTADSIRVRHLVGAAIESRALVSIVGPRGVGKTHAVRAALAACEDVTIIEPCRLDRERMHIGDVVTAIIAALSDERPRHGGEARAAQARRLLGRAACPVLIVDEAHALHHSTTRALKRLREMSWGGRSPLLAVVLVGQTDRLAGIPEVDLRASTLRLTGLSADEARSAITAAIGPACSPEAAARIASSARARTWLDLQRAVDDCLVEAAARGEAQITPEAAAAVLTGAAPEARRTAAAAPSAEDMTAALDARSMLRRTA